MLSRGTIYARINQKLRDRSEHLNFRHLGYLVKRVEGGKREKGVGKAEKGKAKRTLKNALDLVERDVKGSAGEPLN